MPELGAGEGGWQAHLFTTDPCEITWPSCSCSEPQAVHKVLGSRHGSDWDAARTELRRNLVHAPKLAALQELLLDAGGFGAGGGGGGVGGTEGGPGFWGPGGGPGPGG